MERHSAHCALIRSWCAMTSSPGSTGQVRINISRSSKILRAATSNTVDSLGWRPKEPRVSSICVKGAHPLVSLSCHQAILLPKPGMLSVDAIAEYGSRQEPATFARSVNLTHHVSFGPFCYHYELITPRPTDAPIAIEVDRDPDLHMRAA